MEISDHLGLVKSNRYWVVILIWLLSLLFNHIQAQSFSEMYYHLLKDGVIEGEVNYASCKDRINFLDSIMDKGSAELSTNEHQGDFAFLINYYNLAVIRGIVEKYPVASPNEIPLFFDNRWIPFKDKMISLNELEERIFSLNSDPRIHFALVCAAKSCPPLKSSPYRSQTLEQELDSVSAQVFKNSEIFEFDKTSNQLFLSKIFEWYGHHFGGKKGVLAFIEKYYGDLPEDINITYRTYDWSLNDYSVNPNNSESFQQFTPSYLLGKNRLEIKTFINIYSQNKRFNDEFQKLDESLRQTYFTNITEFLYGLSNRLSIGGEIWYKSVYVDSNRSTSPFKIIGEWPTAKKGLTGIGPRIKFTPLNRVQNLSIQSTFLFQPAEDPQGISDQTNFLDFNRNLWINTIYFDKSLNNKTSLFFRLSAWYSLIDEGDNFLETPLAVFVNYFPTSRWTIYFQNELWLKHVNESFSSFFNQTGLGTKFQVIRKYLELELLYTNFVLGSEGEGAGETFNLGLRFIR